MIMDESAERTGERRIINLRFADEIDDIDGLAGLAMCIDKSSAAYVLVSRGHCQTVNDTDSLNPATTTTASARPSTATPQQAMEDPCVLGLNACRHNAKNAEDSKDVEAYFTCVQAVHCNATEAGQMRKTEDLNDARKSLSQFSFNTSNIENEASSILFLNGFLLVVSIVSFISF